MTGIIPAYAGNALSEPGLPVSARDHPRVCGERDCSFCVLEWDAGSSPRMRGTRPRSGAWCGPCGIIPAYAGNAPVRCSTPRAAGDHPRVCGERPETNTLHLGTTGSSPRMRGTRGFSVRGRRGVGDHPRVCGERRRLPCRVWRAGGSSPRMRGTHSSQHRPARQAGIIPAYAGNATGPCRSCRRPRDHPRVCGERSVLRSQVMVNSGSSPRMRGTRVCQIGTHLLTGIIPAYAGNARTSSVPRC